MSENIDCYGKFTQSSACNDCCYYDSCRYYKASAPGVNRGLNLPSLDCISDYCSTRRSSEPVPGEDDSESKAQERVLTLSELAHFFRYLLELDSYTLEILREIIAPVSGKKCNIADLCKLHNVSRQSMHRKIFRVIFKRPELWQLLRSTLDRLPPRQTV